MARALSAVRHGFSSLRAADRAVLRSPPVLAWAAHLLVVVATAAATVAVTPARDARWPQLQGVERYVVAPLAVWDGGWYVRIADDGYDIPEATAFWPLYPLLLRLGHHLTGLPYAAVGVVLSNAAFLPALVALFALARADYGYAVAARAVWLAALWPLSLFFSAVYTEALFLLLTVGAVALGRSGRWTWAALAAAAAALTRNTGALILLPLGVMLLQQRGWHPRGWWRQGIQLAAAACSPLAFARHLDRRWGDPLLMVRGLGAHWGRSTGTPWGTLAAAYDRAAGVYGTGRHACVPDPSPGWIGACRAGLQVTVDAVSDDISVAFVTAALLLLPYALWRLLPRDGLYLAAGFAVPLFGRATEDPLQSVARYLIVLFPMYIALALLLSRRPVFAAAVLASAVALAALVSVFARVYFVA